MSDVLHRTDGFARPRVGDGEIVEPALDSALASTSSSAVERESSTRLAAASHSAAVRAGRRDGTFYWVIQAFGLVIVLGAFVYAVTKSTHRPQPYAELSRSK